MPIPALPGETQDAYEDRMRVERVRRELAEPGAVTKEELRHALDDPIEERGDR